MSRNAVCVGIDVDEVQDHGAALDRQTGDVLENERFNEILHLQLPNQIQRANDVFHEPIVAIKLEGYRFRFSGC